MLVLSVREDREHIDLEDARTGERIARIKVTWARPHRSRVSIEAADAVVALRSGASEAFRERKHAEARARVAGDAA